MTRALTTEIESFPIAGVFTISRGSRTEARVVTCILSENGVSGHGECVPYARYDETVESVVEEIEAVRQDLANGLDRIGLLDRMAPGAARNAVDCALWDLEAKLSGRRASITACTVPPRPLPTAYTISLAAPDEMAAQARAHASRPLLKVKLGSDNDAARIHAVAGAAPESRLIVDANEGWTAENIRENMLVAAEFHVALIEQPLPAGKDGLLRDIPHPVPICADESVHTADNLNDIAGLYDFVNIKLDKTGGLTAALELRDKARDMGFGVMVGCMVGTSLAMAPAVLLAQGADFVDLDGPLLLARDRAHGLSYSGSLVSPPSPHLWG
ncbi:mandelate racemase/muconate lactonizing-like protein [Nitratireductor indicus C115]|uniref:Dipeptide epimerase n=1 Tax=Nitratireductor indicus C115 TaxID=1231190 RepID=K2PNW0_9HYPH|nr:N-acetyl-D-Glu racemase DgcA [Nitratireductor indicus]EKF42752.1 mandelate racemase/muconate lactonizing-like protein [Nitratireductor indicus C115]SFQ39715.1 L-alanine-DL-glutamate epimerase [Nitratireductor indicus]